MIQKLRVKFITASMLSLALVLLVILLVLWAKVFRRNRRYGSRSGRRYRSSSYRGGRRGR